MNIKKLTAIAALAAMITVMPLAGCDNANSNGNNNTNNNNNNNVTEVPDNTQSDNVNDAENEIFVNPGDSLGGGQEANETPSGIGSQNGGQADETVNGGAVVSYEIPEGAVQLTKSNREAAEAGDYYIDSEISGKKVSVTAEGVTLYLSGAALSNNGKVIESDYDLTIVLIGENTVSNELDGDDAKNAVSVSGSLTITGNGSLNVTSVKNAVSANAITVTGAKLNITSDKDGLHAEVDAYDEAETTPAPSYSDGGYVYINNAEITINSAEDGIQADTFVYIMGENTLIDVTAGGGAPSTITSASSDNAEGKGIKAGQIDWGADAKDLEWEGYLICIKGGTINVNANDDGIHSNSEIEIEGGTITVSSGDDGIHSDNLLCISGGTVTVTKSYEGIESANIEISGGVVEVQSYEDGINAADGTTSGGFNNNNKNSNCYIIISGGYVSVNCVGSSGDGIDSNGTILISGGEVYVSGSTGNADATLDSDNGILINGGYLFAAGALGMVETPASNSEQYCVSFAKSTTISAETVLSLCGSDGKVLMYFVTPKACQSLILSCPELEQGETYSIYGGDTLLVTFTVTSKITTVGTSGSINNPGGTPGGNKPGDNSHGFGGGFGGR